MWGRRIGLSIILVSTAIFSAIFYSLRLYRRPKFIQNFEEDEYGPFLDPHSVRDGLAVYSQGDGQPVLLFPYPHGHTRTPMAESELAHLLADMGRQVVTFDVPGAYRSVAKPTGDMAEIIRSADDTLARLEVEGSVDVIGHSMGGFCALAYAIERPQKVRRLVLVGGLSGFPAAARWGLPRSAYFLYEKDFWRVVIWGMRLNGGRADLATHKKLQNLMEGVAYHNKSLFSPLPINPGDQGVGVPIRTIWSKNMYRRLSYADRLYQVKAPTLLLAGRHDPQAPVACSEELLKGIPAAQMIVFEQSGHFPFIEEPVNFNQRLAAFLNKDKTQ
jgi:proline iminopeptidase